METKSGETETTDDRNSLLSTNDTLREAYNAYSPEHKAVVIRLASFLLRGNEMQNTTYVPKRLRRELRSP